MGNKGNYYITTAIAYTSGKPHIGNTYEIVLADSIARFRRQEGYDVFFQTGTDEHGQKIELKAAEAGITPKEYVDNISGEVRKIWDLMNTSYDKFIRTTDEDHEKQVKKIFKKLYEDGLAKQVDMPVNWCEELGTVLANDEVIDGKSERGGYPVVRKYMKQWIIDMPAYAEKLLNGLDELDWPESTKEIQRNWIGKSEGVEVKFKMKDGGEFSIFTTCIETIYGITFMVLAPESKLVDELKDRIKNFDEVEKYRSTKT